MTTSPPKSVALAIAPKVPALLSICGSSSIIYMVLSNQKRRNHIMHRIMLCLSISDILASVFFFASTWPIPKGTPSWFGDGTQPIYGAIGNDQTCNVAGFFNQLQVANPLFNASLATYYYLSVNFNWQQRQLKKIQWRFYSLPFLFAITTSVFAVAANLIGHVEWTCWILPPELFDEETELTPIQSKFRMIQWMFLFGPVWVCIIFISVIFFKLYTKMRALEDKMKRYSAFSGSRTSSFDSNNTRHNSNVQEIDEGAEDDISVDEESGEELIVSEMNHHSTKLEVSTNAEESKLHSRMLRRRVTFDDEKRKQMAMKDGDEEPVKEIKSTPSNASNGLIKFGGRNDLPFDDSTNQEKGKTSVDQAHHKIHEDDASVQFLQGNNDPVKHERSMNGEESENSTLNKGVIMSKVSPTYASIEGMEQSRDNPYSMSKASEENIKSAVGHTLAEHNGELEGVEDRNKTSPISALSSQIRAKRRAFMEAKRSKEIAFQGMLYVLVFWFTWLFPTISRITDLAGVKVYAVQFLDTFFLPLQGLLNFMIYIRPTLKKQRQKKPGANFLTIFRESIVNDNVQRSSVSHD